MPCSLVDINIFRQPAASVLRTKNNPKTSTVKLQKAGPHPKSQNLLPNYKALHPTLLYFSNYCHYNVKFCKIKMNYAAEVFILLSRLQILLLHQKMDDTILRTQLRSTQIISSTEGCQHYGERGKNKCSNACKETERRKKVPTDLKSQYFIKSGRTNLCLRLSVVLLLTAQLIC